LLLKGGFSEKREEWGGASEREKKGREHTSGRGDTQTKKKSLLDILKGRESALVKRTVGRPAGGEEGGNGPNLQWVDAIRRKEKGENGHRRNPAEKGIVDGHSGLQFCATTSDVRRGGRKLKPIGVKKRSRVRMVPTKGKGGKGFKSADKKSVSKEFEKQPKWKKSARKRKVR